MGGKDEDETPFTVHKNLICGRSPFFEAATSGLWRESSSGTVILEYMKLHNFKIYLQYVYDSTTDIGALAKACGPKCAAYKQCCRDDAARPLTYQRPCELWVLGDFLRDDGFCNIAIDALIRADDVHFSSIGEDTVEYIYRETSENSRLQKWVAKRSLRLMSFGEIEGLRWSGICAEYVLDLWEGCVLDKDSVGTCEMIPESDRCKYHRHTEGKEGCFRRALKVGRELIH